MKVDRDEGAAAGLQGADRVAFIAFIADALVRAVPEEAQLVALDLSRKAARRLVEDASAGQRVHGRRR